MKKIKYLLIGGLFIFLFTQVHAEEEANHPHSDIIPVEEDGSRGEIHVTYDEGRVTSEYVPNESPDTGYPADLK